MFRYILVIALLLLGALASEEDKYFLRSCEGVKMPIAFSIKQCPKSKDYICNGILKGAIALIDVELQFKIDKEFTKLPISADVIRNGKTEVIPLPNNACKGFYKEKCPLKPGKHTITFPLLINNVKKDDLLHIGVGIGDPETKKNFACAYFELKAK
uniref:LolMLb n=1 Tax=Bichromomyia olmeca TaxID=715919 RepID=A0A1B1V3F7_9DIPT|nr:LolMLb [Bichromomyia olmeca]